MNQKDTYKTILKPSVEVLFKDRGSKFYGFAYPVRNEQDAKEHIDRLKKEHHGARHWCYAWQLGKDYSNYRANDDGEPSHSAGMPILGQIRSFELTNILVVVVRYFGGIKLGVGGLINAYKTASKMALENVSVVERTIDQQFILSFDYPEINTVMRMIKENDLSIIKQSLEVKCSITISVRKNDAERIFKLFKNLKKVAIKKEPG